MDERIRSAISHWGPRFITNGVAVSDFERVTRGVQRWEDWCEAWSAAGREHEQLGLTALADKRRRSAGEHLAQAAVYFHFGKFLFVDDLDQMRAVHASAVRCLTAGAAAADPPGRRVEIPFEGASSSVCPHAAGPGTVARGGDDPRSRFGKGGVPLDRAHLPRSRSGHLQRGRPGPGRSRVRSADPCGLVGGGRGHLDAVAAEPDIDGERLALWG
jgi:2,6-dihydroxypseudooxynicotine hydrolase